MIKQEPLTMDQLNTLLATATDARDKAMLTLASRHFIRASELAALRVSDVNLKDGSIRISRLKGSISKTESFVPGDREALTAWLTVRDSASNLLFPGRFEKPMHRSQVYNIFRRLAEAAGLPSTSRAPHALRHTIGQIMAQNGASHKHIQQAAGHRSLNSTAQYFEFSQREVDEVKAKMLGFTA